MESKTGLVLEPYKVDFYLNNPVVLSRESLFDLQHLFFLKNTKPSSYSSRTKNYCREFEQNHTCELTFYGIYEGRN